MNPRQIALLWAVLYLRDHNLRAHPETLLEFVDAWIESADLATEDHPMRYDLAQHCGISAAREVAMPCWSPGVTLIEPEDLRD